jgi:tRNA modification GTPase
MIDTIFAPASAPGRSGVAVVRVSGPRAKESLVALGVLSHDPAQKAPLPKPRHAVLRTLKDPQTQVVIDHALVIYFAAPASFTGEDVVEYHIHGGPAVLRMLLAALSQHPGHRGAGLKTARWI